MALTFDKLQELKILANSGQITIDTAMDRLYLLFQQEVAATYEKMQATIPVLENPL
jgi:hypothetical protein